MYHTLNNTSSMKTIEFKQSRLPLKVRFVVENGVLAAAYTIRLSDKNSNRPIASWEGDNINTEDDTYTLPTPSEANDGRLIRLVVDFYGLDRSVSRKYKMGIKLYQGEEVIGESMAEDDLAITTQNLLLFVLLKMV